jgi:heptosyltransferase II
VNKSSSFTNRSKRLAQPNLAAQADSLSESAHYNHGPQKIVSANVHAQQVSNILIRVPNWLGDSMMASPVISAVRKAFPQSTITILSKPNMAPFWRGFSEVREVLVIEKGLGTIRTIREIKKRKFDVALTLPTSFSSAFLLFAADIPVRVGWGGEGRELFLTKVIPAPAPRQKHLVWEYLELVRQGLGRPLVQKTVQLAFPIDSKTKKEAQQLLKSLKVNAKLGLVALGPGATYGPAKRWPLGYWKELISQLLAKGKATLLVLGGPEEKEYLEELWKDLPVKHAPRLVSLVGKTSPQTLAAVLDQCKLLITNDTGPMHVAAAVGTPTVAIFGSTSPTWTRPFGLGHEVIYKAVECSPCYQKTCPIGYICLNRITVDEVLKAAQKQLKGGGVKGEKPPQGVLV